MKLPPLRIGRAPDPVLVERRATPFPNAYPFSTDVSYEQIMLGGLECLSLSPAHARGALLYVHGGGFRLGSPERLASFASILASRARCRVLLPRYPLAPESPFPAALTALRNAAAALSARPLIIGGDSAGGNLAAELCLTRAAPADGLILISPWLDLRVTAPSYTRCAASDRLFSREAASDAAATYLQGAAADDPLVSPILADVTGLPPTLIVVGGVEVLLDECLSFASRLAQAHVQVELHAVPEMQHAAPTFGPSTPGAAPALTAITDFLKRRLDELAGRREAEGAADG
jgi:acetyl esterase/lipase